MGPSILPVEALTDGLSRRYAVAMFHVKRALVRPGSKGALGILAAPPVVTASRRRVGRGTQISYTALLLAVLTGILHAAAAPVIAIGDVHPNFVLVAVVMVTVVRGIGSGVGWAFVAGLTANLLIREPLGSVPLGLLVVAACVSGGERLFGRLSWAYPVAAVAIGSIVVDAIGLGVMKMVDLPLTGGLPVQRILAAALLNAAIAAIVILPTRVLVARTGGNETPAW